MIPQFPNFANLNVDLKDLYNNFISRYPSYSDMTYGSLQIWWNLSEKLEISDLNNNLIINYYQEFDTHNSGLSIIGFERLDISVDLLFKYLKDSQRELKLIHIPEFVIEKLEKQYIITEEPDYHEYILDSSALSKLEGHDYKKIRNQVNRFIKDVGNKKVELKTLDLRLEEEQDKLLDAILLWENKYPTENDPEKTEHLALNRSIKNGHELELRNLALYVNDELQGIIIYDRPHNQDYYISHHLKYSRDYPYASTYLHHQFAKKSVNEKIPTINIEMDLGIDNLRKHKRKLNPSKIFKKFRITPLPS